MRTTVATLVSLLALAALAYMGGVWIADGRTALAAGPAEAAGDYAGARKLADDFVAAFAQGKAAEAMDALQKQSLLPVDALKPVREGLITEADPAKTQLGKIHGTQVVREEGLGGALVRYVYLVRAENRPMQIVMVFYKPQSQWKLTGMAFDLWGGSAFSK